MWLRMLEQSTDPDAIPALLKANRDWLIDANGRGDEDDDETDLERTWTRARRRIPPSDQIGLSQSDGPNIIHIATKKVGTGCVF